MTTVVVGYDRSPDAQLALAWAGVLAAQVAGSEIHLVHALHMPPFPVYAAADTVSQVMERYEDSMRAAMEAEAAAVEAGGIPCRVYLRRWLAAETVLDQPVTRRRPS